MSSTRPFKSMRPALESGGPLLGWYATFQLADVIELVGDAWDWFWIDMQHSPIDMPTALSMVRAAEAANAYSLIRVGQNDPYLIASALDLGASGVIVPMVNTADEARAVVRAAKFPPMGRRSYGSRRLVGRHGYDYADRANEDTVVLVQLESAQAFANADTIAAVEGIDAIIFSPDDYTREKGLNVVVPRPANLGAAEKQVIVAAAKSHAKMAGCFCDSPDSLRVSLEAGYRLICVAQEDEILIEASARIQSWTRDTAQWTLGENGSCVSTEGSRHTA